MKRTDDISHVIQQLRVPASAALDHKVHGAIAQATARPAPASASIPDLTLGQVLRILMKKKSTRYTLATTLVLALLAAVLLNQFTTSAWAMEQAIKALQKYKALHIMGYTTSGSGVAPLEIWARANASGTASAACLAKLDSITVWVQDNETYAYEPAQHKVFVEPGITAGLNPWFGPKFLATLARMRDYQAHEGTDAATGQKRVLVSGSIESVLGPQSFLIEFNAQTKLPVTLKRWRNLKRQGVPDFVCEKIVYFEDLPDSVLSFEPPSGVQFVDKPLTIPEANLPALSASQSGISADGLTQEEACRKLLGQFWTACIQEDMARIHQLCPLTSKSPDGLFRELAGQDEAVELLSIGGIAREGQSKLGPLALVPSRLRCKDGKVREIWMVVQFRQTEQGTTCVVHGPHGNSVELK